MDFTGRIVGTGSFLPRKVLDNFELSERVPNKSEAYPKGFDLETAKTRHKQFSSRGELFNAEAVKKSGIAKRCVYRGDFDHLLNFRGSAEHMGAEASEKALCAAEIPAEKLECIIATTFSANHEVPNMAATIGNLIGAKHYESLTINTACTGFIQGLLDAWDKTRAGRYNYVLVVASEYLTSKTNYNDFNTAILFADGAGAAVLKAEKAGNSGILGGIAGTQYAKNIRLDSDLGYLVIENGGGVLKNAIELMGEVTERALENANLSRENINYFIPHQANKRITRGLIKKLGVPKERVIDTIENYGNTSCASVPISLDKAVRGEIKDIRIKRGDRLCLTAFAGGFCYASLVMVY